jgi:hypothetical protein
MRATIVAIATFVALGAASTAYGQMTGGGGSGIGAGPPGALPNGGLGATNAPPANRENTVVPPSAGLKDQSGSGLIGSTTDLAAGSVNQIQPPSLEAPRAIGGFSGEDAGGWGTAPASGDGLITGSGARLRQR